jgi:molybdopterin-guanine dinucleotide biosynthesis protein A
VDALVLAGGRIDGPYAAAVGTTIKALADVSGAACVRRVVEALRAAPSVGAVCVVGPPELRDALPPGVPWRAETATALENIVTGLDALSASGETQVLIQGADVPALTPEALQDLIDRTPPEAEFALPVVTRERFRKHFPGSDNLYVHLAEGAFTGGSQYLIQPEALRRNQDLLERLFRNRKSQVGMAVTLGLPLLFGLLTRRLTIPELERQAGKLTGARCCAIPDCHPELAYDIDRLIDLEYIRRWFAERNPT